MRRMAIIMVVGAAVIGGAGWAVKGAGGEYTAQVVLPAATGLVEGSKVLIDGFDAGQVSEISAVDGKARVVVELDEKFAPLRSGAQAAIVWKAALGERQVDLRDGAKSNPPIPNGGTLRGKMAHPVEMDAVLNALDARTRSQLRSLISRLSESTGGNEVKLRETLRASGPAVGALGELLRGLGSEGRAIESLVSETNRMIGTLSRRDSLVREIVQQLSGAVGETAARRKELRSGLARLPDVLTTADRVLGTVPGTADEAIPLLRDARPAAQRLPSVAEKLQPVLRDLRPMVAELRPTLRAADSLLQYTPGLMDSMKDVVPSGEEAIDDLTPALTFLRPYTPEVVGWLSNWASSAGNYDSNGRYMRISVPGSGSSFNHNPGAMPPGMIHDPYPLPGELVGQPWRDAYGSKPR